VSQPTLPPSPLPFPPDRPRWAVITVRTIQTALAGLALAVAAMTFVARPAPDQARPPTQPVVIVTDTTLRPAAYSPTPRRAALPRRRAAGGEPLMLTRCLLDVAGQGR
jgi:hypothetical protein